MRAILILICCCWLQIAFAQGKKKAEGGSILSAGKGTRIQILNANTLEYTKDSKVKRLIGDVRFKQDDLLLYCDSAYLYDEENLVEAYNHVLITRPDSFSLRGDFLRYDGNARKARLTGNVQLVDASMTLSTSDLDFDMASNIGYYTNGATIVSKQNTLTSVYGYYYTKTSQVFFKKNVKLLNPEYTIDCDTLQYNSASKVAYFYGPTYIKSDDNTIYCENGWYDTQREQAQFSRNAMLISKENTLKADSLVYNRRSGIGKGFRNIELLDTAEKLQIRGNYGEVHRQSRNSFITRNARAKKMLEKDSIYLLADTLFYMQNPKDSSRILKAYYQARIYKSDIQALSDSIVYSMRDSNISMYRNPLMWSEEKQLSSDTMKFFMNGGRIDSMHLNGNAFIASKEGPKDFNQIKGRDMKGYFKQQKLERVYVFGNGQSVYYAKDSAGYIGINKIECSFMMIQLDSNKLKRIMFYNQPKGSIYPVDKMPEEEKKLKGFKWHEALRPRFNSGELF